MTYMWSIVRNSKYKALPCREVQWLRSLVQIQLRSEPLIERLAWRLPAVYLFCLQRGLQPPGVSIQQAGSDRQWNLQLQGCPLGFRVRCVITLPYAWRILRGEAERRKEVCTCTESSRKTPGAINTWLLSCCSTLLGYFSSGTYFFMNLGY